MSDKHDDLRAEFEAAFPAPYGVVWSGSEYEVRDDYVNSYTCDRFVGRWDAWQAAYSAGQRAAALRAAQVCMPSNDPSDWTEYAKTRAECAAAILRDAGIDKEQG